MSRNSIFQALEAIVDLQTRRKKQQALMKRMLERKVRSRAQQLYESRGQAEGRALEDWFQAEAEILENPSIARLYRRLKAKDVDNGDDPLAAPPEEARA